MRKYIQLGVLLFLCSVGIISAQNTQLYLQISPNSSVQGMPLLVELNKPVQFSAKAYMPVPGQRTDQEVPISTLLWSVDPTGFGSINASGLFEATGPSGGLFIQEGRIIANAEVNGLTITGTVAAKIGTNSGGSLDYSIQGTVKNANGDPIINAQILALGGSPPNTNLSAKTDVNGEYIVRVPAGSYYVRASAQGYVSEYYDNATSSANAKKITTDPNQKDISGIDFVLGMTGKISGTVYDDQRMPLAYASVMAYGASGVGNPGGSNNAYSARAGQNGTYIIEGVSEGDYIVQASHQGYKVQYYNQVADKQNATPVNVKEGQTSAGIDFLLAKDIIVPPTYYEISGSVKDGNGNGIEGAVMVAQGQTSYPNNGQAFSAKTDQNGDYTLKVTAGTYIVSATAAGLLKEYYDNVGKAELATKITVDANNTSATGIDFTLGQGGSISGTVINAATQSPIKGAYVYIGTSGSGTPGNPNQSGYGSMTDEQGNYKLAGLFSGEYTVLARADGFALQYYDKVADATLATKVQVTEGQTTSGIDFALTTLPGISGNVTDVATNLPISRATVSATGNGVKTVVYTNENGEYHLPLSAGTYIIQASAYKYATEWYNEQSDASLADAVTIGTVSVDNVNFTLERWGGTIRGVVTDASNTGIQGAIVKVWGAGSNTNPINNVRFYEKAVTLTDGSYEVLGVPPGKYYVMASATGFISEYFDNAITLSNATMVDVTNQNVTDDIDFELSKGGSITGVITDSKTNLPIKGAVVSLKGLTSTSLGSTGTRTDENGMYTISGLPTGGYYLYAAAYGYYGKSHPSDPNSAPVQVTAPNTTSGVDIALEPAPKQGRFRFTGTVLDAQTQMKADAFVEVISTVSGMAITSATKADGRFEILTDEPGVVRSYAAGYVGAYAGNKRTWQESSPQMNQGEITFDLEPQVETGFAMLSGRVLDSKTNAPVSDAWVFGTDAEGNSFFTITDQGGYYRIAGTSTGSLDLLVSGADYSPAQGTGDISGTEGTLNLSANRVNSPTDVEKPALPSVMTLSQNFPNPFNPSTTISFSLPVAMQITLKITNLLGQEIATLHSGLVEAGSHRVTWNTQNVPSGVYLYKLEANGKTLTRQMILTK